MLALPEVQSPKRYLILANQHCQNPLGFSKKFVDAMTLRVRVQFARGRVMSEVRSAILGSQSKMR
jgi:hypothetical protein